jgi:hypothetical protein
MFTVTNFDPFEANDHTWEDYFNFNKNIAGAYLKIDEFKVWLKEKNKKFKLIYQDNVLVMAIAYFFKKGLSGSEILFIAIESIQNEPSASLSKTIANAICQLTANNPAKSFRLTTGDPLIQEIIAGFKGKIVNTINYYQLNRSQLNEAILREWQINPYMESGALTLAIHGYVPENLHSRYAALMTELMNAIVRDDNDEYFEETAEGVKQKMEVFKKSGVKMLTLMLSDMQERLIGISIMLVYPNSVVANQEMTGIIAQYRGKKLAHYLKAMITEEAFRRFPEIATIETNCYSANKPMIHINQLTGYAMKETSFQFSVDIEKIEELLAAS